MLRIVSLVLACGAIILAPNTCEGQQNSASIVAAGYRDPVTIRVSPGQVTTLFVSGLKNQIPGGRNRFRIQAEGLPLPRVLSGISVSLKQPIAVKDPMALPLFSIEQQSTCFMDGTPITEGCVLTMITVQIPYELHVPNRFGPPEGYDNQTAPRLIVTENGSPSREFDIVPTSDNVHIVTSCDTFFLGGDSAIGSRNPCFVMITHANGNLVSLVDPALPGEYLVAYAFGLGSPLPVIATGVASETPVAGGAVALRLDFRQFAAPAPPNRASMDQIDPLYVGLVPGYVGLYQINFRVPQPPPGTAGCPVTAAMQLPGPTLTDNATLTIAGAGSFDGATLCVKVP